MSSIAVPGKNVQQWLDRVHYDLETAEAMLHARRYVYVVFMCQQAVEKCLKAVAVSKKLEVVPVHNLRRLAELSGIILTDEKLLKLDFLSEYYINSRYKEDLAELSKGITHEFAGGLLAFSKELISWLTQGMK